VDLPADTVSLLKRSIQMIALVIQIRPSPSDNDFYIGQEYQPVIHRLHLLLRSHLRVASPAHDERGGGNHGHSADPILTDLTLLIPASVPLTAPANLPVHLHCCQSTPLPLPPAKGGGKSMSSVFCLSLVEFLAHTFSASELLRFLSRMAASEPTS
jgi:hypothetical protein